MTRIKSITVQRSKFFQSPMSINFSGKLNCIMGGRGTGKTTLLRFLQSVIMPSIEEDKSVFGLLKSNLKDGKIILQVENLNGELFTVEKTLGEEPVVYTMERSLVDFNSFRQSISIDFYEASQIEKIATDPSERLKLIEIGRAHV